jgi:hypothetical protein
MENLAVTIENGQVQFPDIPELISELKMFSFERSDLSGRTIYNAPSGFNDDCVIALALLLKLSHTEPLQTNISSPSRIFTINRPETIKAFTAEETWEQKLSRLRHVSSNRF